MPLHQLASTIASFLLPPTLPPFPGAVQVPCSDPNAVFQSTTGICWANTPGVSPLPPPISPTPTPPSILPQQGTGVLFTPSTTPEPPPPPPGDLLAGLGGILPILLIVLLFAGGRKRKGKRR